MTRKEFAEKVYELLEKAYWATVSDDGQEEGKTARGWIVEAERFVNDNKEEKGGE